MPFKVTIQNTGHEFQADPGVTILQAARNANLVLPHGCRDGACGSCKGKLISGAIDYGTCAELALSDAEKHLGCALFCQAIAKSDLVIEVREVRKAGHIRKLPARVHKIERVTDDVTILHLKLPAGERLLYSAGQYVDFLLQDSTRRSFSIANAPREDELLQLHVRLVPGGLFTGDVFNKMKEGEILRLEGPRGTFCLREDSHKPIVFVAGGTGIAPIKAIIEHAFQIGIMRPMTLYWGGRRPKDFYMSALIEQWSKEHANFKFVAVVSDALTKACWSGRSGFVHRAVMADLPDLSAYQVYVCGLPVMVNSAKKDFIEQCKLPATEIYADSFTSAADLA
jgi:CDP-4-dehydro-6-deoxyglucose reductase